MLLSAAVSVSFSLMIVTSRLRLYQSSSFRWALDPTSGSQALKRVPFTWWTATTIQPAYLDIQNQMNRNEWKEYMVTYHRKNIPESPNSLHQSKIGQCFGYSIWLNLGAPGIIYETFAPISPRTSPACCKLALIYKIFHALSRPPTSPPTARHGLQTGRTNQLLRLMQVSGPFSHVLTLQWHISFYPSRLTDHISQI